MGEAVGGAQHVVPLDADDLLERAESSAGDVFRDLGDGDWEARFRCLVEAVNDNPLHVVGRLMSREELLRCLRTRINLGRVRAEHPGVADETINRPVAVVGPARSGTTISFELIGLDPTLRTPIASEVIHAASPIAAAERARITECEQELWADVQPEFDSIHELRSDLPVECVTISAPSFAGYHWLPLLPEHHGDWRLDAAADIALHRVVLQSLQYGREPKSWLLKTPVYLVEFDNLITAYPDVSIVQTHRDPARTMPSTVSTQISMEWVRSDHVDIAKAAAVVGPFFGGAIRKLAERRRSPAFAQPIGDIRYLDLMNDPVAAIAAVYDQLGRTFTDEHARAIIDYLASKPKGKHGVHSYSAAEWGFDAADVRGRLAGYLDEYGVAAEA